MESASTNATAPATRANRSERPGERGPVASTERPSGATSGSCSGSTAVAPRRPFRHASAATSCSASSRVGSSSTARASASTASRGGSDRPPRYRSHDFWLYPVRAASCRRLSPL